MDKVGPICRNVDDCALVLSCMHGADPRDRASVDRPYVWPSSRELSTLRVGYLASDEEERKDALDVLRNLGVQLTPVELPKVLEEYDLPFGFIEAIATVESSAPFEDLTRRGEPKGVKLWPGVWAYGPFWTGIDYLKLSRIRSQLMEEVDKVMQTVDVFFGGDGRTLTNLTGHPKIAVPDAYPLVDGFVQPHSQSMIGRVYDESTLLALADAFQRSLNLKERPPLEDFLAEKVSSSPTRKSRTRKNSTKTKNGRRAPRHLWSADRRSQVFRPLSRQRTTGN
jgi:Asp-tRNA(Asn)/Glu-tRNA(Gln) amidotransferase A subunit family amidase